MYWNFLGTEEDTHAGTEARRNPDVLLVVPLFGFR